MFTNRRLPRARPAGQLAGWVAVAILAGAGLDPAPAHGAEVNVYSARKENLIKPLLDRFTARTGVTVNLVTAKAGPLLKRLEAEGANSPADLFITTDAGRLYRAKAAGVLQAVRSKALEAAVPAALRDPAGYWYGLSLRARPILYVRSRVNPAELSTYEALADDRWKGRVCIRSSNNIYNQSLVASMIAARGEAETLAWLKRFVRSFARSPKGGDRDQIKAAAAGQCDIAIANTYYFAAMLASKRGGGQREAARKLAVFWPNQEGRGTHVNVSGAGVTRASKNRDEAIRLLEFLVTDASQAWYAEVNYEYPAKVGVKIPAVVRGLGEFKADALNLSLLGENNARAVMLMDRAGWR